jgi:hypothetical protein
MAGGTIRSVPFAFNHFEIHNLCQADTVSIDFFPIAFAGRGQFFVSQTVPKVFAHPFDRYGLTFGTVGYRK